MRHVGEATARVKAWCCGHTDGHPSLETLVKVTCCFTGGQTSTSQQAPDPLSSSNQQGHITWGTAGPDDPFRMFKFVMMTPNNWQLDGHVRNNFTPDLALALAAALQT